ncbi:MAG: molybdenum cofactor biosynthesis protein MoaE [Chloroflexota bacterium]
MAEIKIKLFATLKDRTGHNRIKVEATTPLTIADLFEIILVDYPQLADALPTALIAVNKTFAFPTTVITENDEIALFPPVSGGSPKYPTYFAITNDPLDINAIHAQLTQPDIGSIVSFTGSVRGKTAREGLPAETTYLEYESYTDMALLKMGQIAAEIWEKWPLIRGVAIVQRVGKLDIGENTTFVACASGHRDQGGFEAARYGIDRLKEIVPVWKKEVGTDKSVWIEGDYHPTPQDNA